MSGLAPVFVTLHRDASGARSRHAVPAHGTAAEPARCRGVTRALRSLPLRGLGPGPRRRSRRLRLRRLGLGASGRLGRLPLRPLGVGTAGRLRRLGPRRLRPGAARRLRRPRRVHLPGGHIRLGGIGARERPAVPRQGQPVDVAADTPPERRLAPGPVRALPGAVVAGIVPDRPVRVDRDDPAREPRPLADDARRTSRPRRARGSPAPARPATSRAIEPRVLASMILILPGSGPARPGSPAGPGRCPRSGCGPAPARSRDARWPGPAWRSARP